MAPAVNRWAQCTESRDRKLWEHTAGMPNHLGSGEPGRKEGFHGELGLMGKEGAGEGEARPRAGTRVGIVVLLEPQM